MAQSNKMETIAENISGKGVYDEEKKILLNSFHGPAIIENGMHIFEKELEFVKGRTIYGLLFNTQKLFGSFSQLNSYLEEIYYPEMISHGLQYVAIVISFDIFSQFSLEDMIQRMGKLEICTFYRVNDAQSWLDKKVGQVINSL